jgi:hypothetical protein
LARDEIEFAWVMQPMPKGLKMIAGNSTASTPGNGTFDCLMPVLGITRGGTSGTSIPTQCQQGDDLRTVLVFPQCWDGVNLDSPDHKSHMSHAQRYWTGDPLRQYRCPDSHPVVLPQITYVTSYPVPAGGNPSSRRRTADKRTGFAAKVRKEKSAAAQ